MDKTINAKELRASLPRIVERVRRGERFTVLYRSRPAFPPARTTRFCTASGERQAGGRRHGGLAVRAMTGANIPLARGAIDGVYLQRRRLRPAGAHLGRGAMLRGPGCASP